MQAPLHHTVNKPPSPHGTAGYTAADTQGHNAAAPKWEIYSEKGMKKMMK